MTGLATAGALVLAPVGAGVAGAAKPTPLPLSARPLTVFVDGAGNLVMNDASPTDEASGNSTDLVVRGATITTRANPEDPDVVTRIETGAGCKPKSPTKAVCPFKGRVVAHMYDENDVIDISAPHGGVIDGGASWDWIIVRTSAPVTIYGDGPTAPPDDPGGNEIHVVGKGPATIWAGDGDYPNEVWGGKGDDTIYGSTGMDELHGGPGNDTIYGMGGDDLMDGGSGIDRIYPGTPSSP